MPTILIVILLSIAAMAQSVTPNLGLVKPPHNGSFNTWDVDVNGNMDKIDAWAGSLTIPTGAPTSGVQFTGNGTAFVPQPKTVIDVRDTAGIDCTGATDSSTALNTIFASLSNKKLVIPTNCQLRADNPLFIIGQESFIIEGQGDRPNILGGPSIFGCNGVSGPLLLINRSGFWTLKGFGLFPKGITAVCASSSFVRSVDIDNSGGGGFTTTHGSFDHMGFTTNIQGGAITNYIGINIIGSLNTEHMIIRDSWFHCQNSSNSFAVRVAAGASDNDLAEGNSFNSCFQGVRQVAGNIRIVQNHFGNTGAFSVYGLLGAAIYIGQCSSGPINILYNEESDGGPFINSNDDANGGCTQPFNIIGNIIGVSDITTTQYPVNLGTARVPYFFEGNDVYVFPLTTTKSAIGSSSQANCSFGPLGSLIDIGNRNQFPANTGGWEGCVGGPDYQEGHIQIMSDSDGTVLTSGALKISAGIGAGSFQLPSLPIASLPASPNGTLFYCSDCKNVTDDTTGTFDSVAAGSGHGTNVLRENGAWRVH